MPHELNPNVQFRNLVSDMSSIVDEAILNLLDSHNPDEKTLASLAEARAGVVRMDHALKIVTISIGDEQHPHNEQLPQGAQPKPLPKVKALPLPKGTKASWEKQRPGIGGKLKRPRDYDCPTCLAEAGSNCFKFSMQGKHGVVTDERNAGTTFHATRQALSVVHNDRVKREYDRAMAKEHEHE